MHMKVTAILTMISMMKSRVITGTILHYPCHNQTKPFFFLFSSQAIFTDTIDYSHRNMSTLDTNEIFTLVKDPTRIKNFQLNSNMLLTIPSQIEQFQSLITIELSNNQLVQLPAEISSLKNLKHLFLKSNALDDLSLPKEFDQLKQLEVINLGGNRLKQFPYQLFHMFNLKEIYLGSNQISFLPDLFQTLIK